MSTTHNQVRVLFITLGLSAGVLPSQTIRVGDYWQDAACFRDLHAGKNYSDLGFDQDFVRDPAGPLGYTGFVKHGCSGTLIGPNLFLTAAHCLNWEARTDWSVSLDYQRRLFGSQCLPTNRPQIGFSYMYDDILEHSEHAGFDWADYAIVALRGDSPNDLAGCQPGQGWAKLSVDKVYKGEALGMFMHPSGRPKLFDADRIYHERRYVTKEGLPVDRPRTRIHTCGQASGAGTFDANGSLVAVYSGGSTSRCNSAGSNSPHSEHWSQGTAIRSLHLISPIIQALVGYPYEEYMSGVNCKESMNGQTDHRAYYANRRGVGNKSKITNLVVHCPIDVKQVHRLAEHTLQVRLWALDNNTNSGIQCRLSSTDGRFTSNNFVSRFDYLETAAAKTGASWTGSTGDNNDDPGGLDLELKDLWRFHTLRCIIPPQGSGDPSSILGYRVRLMPKHPFSGRTGC